VLKIMEMEMERWEPFEDFVVAFDGR